MQLTLNFPLLSADIRTLAGQSRELKRRLRARWTKPMADEQRELCSIKRRATELYTLLAFARGKFHLQLVPRGAPTNFDALAYHRSVSARLGPAYALILEQSA